VNGNLLTNLKDSVGQTLWQVQLKAMGVTLVLAVGGTWLIAWAIQATLGLRPTIEAEQEGLDQTDHGEHGYIHDASNI
jgi:Amt family ammonium transporter